MFANPVRDIPMRLVTDFSDVLDGRLITEASVSASGEALVLLVDRSIASKVSDNTTPGWMHFPNGRNRDPYDATLLVHDGANSWEYPIPGLTIRYPYIQLLPQDEVLLVFARCTRHSDGSIDRNAVVYGVDGAIRRTFVLGDGIESVQANAHGDIWVSYYDEGIFGNYGWGGGATTEPIGSSGLVLFDVEGNIRWRFSPPPGFDYMAGCYALNVTNADAWSYYYTEFPLVRVGSSRDVRGWSWGVGGFSNLATDGNRVLFSGGYRKLWTNASMVEFGETSLLNASACRLTLPDGSIPSNQAAVYGRGSILHAFNESKWYTVDVRDIAW